MAWFRRAGLNRMLLGLVALVLIPLFALQAYTIYNHLNARAEQELSADESLARANGQAVMTFLQDIWDTESAMGDAIVLSRDGMSPDEIEALMKAQFHDHPAIFSYSWTTPDGRILVSTYPNMNGQSVADREFIQRIQGGARRVVSDLLTARGNGHPAIMIASGVRENGQLKGIIIAATDAVQLGNLLVPRNSPYSDVVLLDRQGKIIYRRMTPDLPMDRRQLDMNSDAPAPRVLREGTARVRRFEASLDGEIRMGAGVMIPGIGWASSISDRTVDVLGDAQRGAMRDAIILLALTTASLIVAHLTSSRLLRPAHALQEAALAITAGDLTARTHATEADEISQAARAFDEMAERVEQAEAILMDRARQQAAVAAYGQRALTGPPLLVLLEEAVQMAAQTLGVEFCLILELTTDGENAICRAGVGMDPAMIGAFIPLSDVTVADYTLNVASPVLIEDLRTDTRFRPSRYLNDHGVVSNVSVPIPGRRGPFGVLSAASREIRQFNDDEANLLVAFAGALGALYERERLQRRMATEHAVARILAESEPLTSSIPRLLRAICHGLDWQVGALWLPDEAGETIRCAYTWNAAVTGLDFFTDRTSGTVIARGQALPGWVWERGEPAWLHDVSKDDRFTRGAVADAAGLHGGVCFPIRSASSILGVMEFFSTKIRRPDSDLLRMMESIGNQIGLGIEKRRADDQRTMLLLREQAARADAEKAQRRLAFLAEASALLAASLDFETTLGNVAQLAVPRIADWCAIHVVGRDGSVRQVASAAGQDLFGLQWDQILEQPYSQETAAPFGLEWVLQTGQPDLYPEIPSWLLRAGARDDEHLQELRAAGFASGMIVPLQAHGRTLGAITFITAGSDRRFEPADLALAEEVAHRAALAVENANLYADTRDALRSRDIALAQVQQLNTGLERRVAERTAELETAVQELEAFSYSVSHDLRAPLRVIDGFSKALEEDCAPQLGKEGYDHLQRIRAGTQRMGQLIDAMLHLSRVTRSEMKREPVDLSAIARSVAAELQGAAPGRQAEFAIADGLTAPGDSRLMRGVLENLLGNAFKFTSQRPLARIAFGKVLQEGETVFFVRDNGAGFDMRYAHKLFGAFQRLHSVGEFEGTGIGLATVYRIIRRHGGMIWAEGEVDHGATFYFTL